MKKHLKERILALWLAVCMVLTMMPSMAMPVFAESIANGPEWISAFKIADKVVVFQGGEGTTAKPYIGEVAVEQDVSETAPVAITPSGDASSAKAQWALQPTGTTTVTTGDEVFSSGEEGLTGISVTGLGADGKQQIAFKLDKDGEGESYEYCLVNVYASGNVKASLNKAGSLVKGDEAAAGTEITLSIDEPSALKFKQVENIDYPRGEVILGGAIAGLECRTIKNDGDAIKLGLAGTPTTDGAINVTVKKDLFDVQPKEDIVAGEGTPKVEVVLGTTTAPVPDVTQTVVRCDDESNLSATIPLTGKKYTGKVEVKVYTTGDAEATVDGLTGTYDEDTNSIKLKFPAAIDQETTYKIQVKEREKEWSEKVDVKVDKFIATTDAPVWVEDSVTADEGNTAAKVEVSNKDKYKGNVTVALFADADNGTVKDNEAGTYKDGVLSLTWNTPLTKEKVLYVTFKDGDKLVSNPPVKVTVKPVTKKPVKEDEEIKSADNKKVDVKITNNDPDYIGGTVAVKVYTSEDKTDTTEAKGVKGSYNSETGVLTLTFEDPGLEKDEKYWVAFALTKNGTKYEESARLLIEVKHNLRTPTPRVGTKDVVEVTCKKDNKTAEFNLTNSDVYSKNTSAKIYDEKGNKLSEPTVAYSYSDGKVTISYKETLKASQTYQIKLTDKDGEVDLLESAALTVIVKPYQAAKDSEIDKIVAKVDGQKVEAELVESNNKGGSDADAIPYKINVVETATVSEVTLTIDPDVDTVTGNTYAEVTYKVAAEKVIAGDHEDWTPVKNANGTVTINSLEDDFTADKYLHVKVVAENGALHYYVITLDVLKLQKGDQETVADYGGHEAQLKDAVDAIALKDNANEEVLNQAVVDAIANDTALRSKMDDTTTVINQLKGAGAAGSIQADDIHYYYIPYLDIAVETYVPGESMKLNIEPRFKLIASIENTYDAAKDDEHAVPLEKAGEVTVTKDVTVTLVVPESIAVDGEFVYVRHDDEDGYYKEVGSSQEVELTVSGFSPFYIQKKIDGQAYNNTTKKVYKTVQEAVNDVKNEEEIILTEQATVEDLWDLDAPAGLMNTQTFKIKEGDSGIFINRDSVSFKDIMKDDTDGTHKRYHAVVSDSGDGTVTITEATVYLITKMITGKGDIDVVGYAAPKEKVSLVVSGTLRENGLSIYNYNASSYFDPKLDSEEKTKANYSFEMPASDVIIYADFTGSSEVEPAPGPGGDTPAPTTGDLTVSKTVAGDEGDKTKEFNFTVTLSNTGINGAYGNMTFASGVAAFKLKDGQSVKATGLPKDVTYTVAETEANQDGYTTTSTGAVGTITAGGSAAAAFTNTKGNVSPEPTIEPSESDKLVFTDERQPKALLDRSTTDKDCALKLAAADGDELTDIKVTSSDPKVVKVLKDGKLRYMDLGTAEITVTATGKNGKTYTITFPVTVTKIGRPTLTVSNKISKKGKTFTVTTSTVRGADGFIVKYSLKKNMSNNGKKKFACGKKLKRQPITVKKGKTTYYVKVRAYKKVDGKIVKYAWSKETEKIKSR